jgi:hypothetical protein
MKLGLLKFWIWLTTPYRKFKLNQEYKKRLAEIRKRDPFIYR